MAAIMLAVFVLGLASSNANLCVSAVKSYNTPVSDTAVECEAMMTPSAWTPAAWVANAVRMAWNYVVATCPEFEEMIMDLLLEITPELITTIISADAVADINDTAYIVTGESMSMDMAKERARNVYYEYKTKALMSEL